MIQTIPISEVKTNLSYFTGTEKYYKHSIAGKHGIFLTDGCHYLREQLDAYWLFDLISSYQYKLAKETFQMWKLTKVKDNSWTITATNGNGEILANQFIPFSDFPLEEGISLFLVDNVAMLLSEY